MLASLHQVAAQSPITPTATISPEQILEQARAINQTASDASNAADRAMNAVNLILGFIQVGGLALTIMTAVAAFFGLVSTAQYRQKMETEIQTLSAQMNEEKRKLAEEKDRAIRELVQAQEGLAIQRTELSLEIAQLHEQFQNSNRAMALMQLGEQQLEFRNIKGALQLYQQAYDLDNGNPAINFFLGELYLHERQIETGRYHLDHAKAEGKAYAPVEAAYGYALRLQGDQEKDDALRDMYYAQAEAQFQKALLIDENVLNLLRESVHGWLGGLYKRQGRYDKAIVCYEKAHGVTPQSSYPVINLANLLYTQGKIDVALDYYRRSEFNSSYKLERNPSDYWALLNRMVARLALNRFEEALNDWRSLHFRLPQLSSAMVSILGDLHRLKVSPQPPRGIDQMIVEVKTAYADNGHNGRGVTVEQSVTPPDSQVGSGPVTVP